MSAVKSIIVGRPSGRGGALKGALHRQQGFTLIESILVIVITGVIAGVVAVFMQSPVTGYFDTVRRAELSDTADTALRRIARDLHAALPNSVRVLTSGGVAYLELFPAQVGARYLLDTASESCFIGGCSGLTTLGSAIAADGRYVGESLVIFNYYNNSGNDCSSSLPSAYCGQNRATISSSVDGGSQDTFSFAAAKRFYPAGGSPGRRLHIVSPPVSYVCDPATGLLTRYAGYGINAAQSTTFAGASSALLAKHVSACSFKYQPGVWERTGLATLRLSLTDHGETVSLYHEVHVDNSP